MKRMFPSKLFCLSLVAVLAFVVPAWCLCPSSGQAMATGSLFASSAGPPDHTGSAQNEKPPQEHDASCHAPPTQLPEEQEKPGPADRCGMPGDENCPCGESATAATVEEPAKLLLPSSSLPVILAVPAPALPQSILPHTFFEQFAQSVPAQLRLPVPLGAPSLLSLSTLLTP